MTDLHDLRAVRRERQEVRHERQEVRRERQEVRRDRQEVRREHQEVRRDRQEVRRDRQEVRCKLLAIANSKRSAAISALTTSNSQGCQVAFYNAIIIF